VCYVYLHLSWSLLSYCQHVQDRVCFYRCIDIVMASE